ncbi:FAD-dependent monooxygenase [Streptomyces gardneri]|uniref:FAD-dependent monooxygenase n=1 Tax=Nocardia TaxID=1817 RepID=UPI001359E45D|nr:MULTISPECIES: FAD-dependent monooxygenase [Nocardia]MBF6166023.1 FAD-dependent monooxygenase [Streptomyces gardneri]
MTSPLKVAIVGGGIGGVSAALAVRRAGHEVVCFERSSELGEAGAGIQIGPNASRLLHRLGLSHALAAVAVEPARVQIRRWNSGKIIKEIDAGGHVAAIYGAPYYTVHRADLHRVLVDALPGGVIRTGLRCVGVDQDDDGVSLRFDDGSGHRADVVIGADGLGSELRRLLHSGAARFSGKAAWRVLVPVDSVAHLAEPPMTRMWLGPGKHVVCYPISAGSLLNLAAAVPAPDADIESWTREGPVDEFAAAMAGWDPDLHTILAAATTTLRLPLFDRPPLEKIGLGRVTLLGDAAHPMLPFFAQGAAQAIEDAWVLGRSLDGVSRAGVPDALRRYERARHARTATVQQRSIRNGDLFQLPDGIRQRARDVVMRGFTLNRFDWLYGYDADRAVAAGARLPGRS